VIRAIRFALAATVAIFGLHCSSSDEGGDTPAAEQKTTVNDNVPGTLVITAPARAAFIKKADGDIEVLGSGATSALTINGKPAEVHPDGTFRAMVTPVAGLNVITAVDDESKLETPFLYGNFGAITDAVAQAVGVAIGPKGLDAPAPAATLTSIGNLVLKDKDLMAPLKGKTFEGSTSGATYSYKVSDAKYASANVGLAAKAEGLGITAIANNVTVDGTLTVKVLGKSLSGPVKITVDRANVKGDAKLSVDDKGAIRAEMPNADATLDGFKYDSNNAGFPCCVDSVVTGVLKPKVEQALEDAVKNQVPDAVKVTLEGLGLPKEIDLSGFSMKPVSLATRFDGLTFDAGGGWLTASVLFASKFEPGQPGTNAPGWLRMGQAAAVRPKTDAFGLSFSLDSINQLLFSIWGTGSLASGLPDAGPLTEGKFSPALPPIIIAKEGGALRVALGEVNIDAKLSGKPFTAAASVIQDVTATMEGDVLVLAGAGGPTISITWLKADEIPDSLRKIIVATASDQLVHYLKGVRLPLPTISLEKLGPAFKGQSLALQNPKLAVDAPGARLGMTGAMELKR
jgi:hypothetical protein